MFIGDKFDLRVEKYKLNEKSDINLEDSDIKEHLNYIEEDNKDFLKKFDISSLVNETKSKLNNQNKISPFISKTFSTLVAAAACFIIAINIFPNLNKGEKEIILLKGSEQINIYIKEKESINKLRNMDKVYKNDQLQITYKSNKSYGIIFSLDGLNNITFHYPENQFDSTRLDIGKEVTLPTSYTLDNAPYFEKFYLITSDKSFDFNLVRNATLDIIVDNGRIVTDLTLPNKYKINTLTLIKD